MFITTLFSLHISLRWLRRTMTIILILSNFAATVLADAPGGRPEVAMLLGSILICLFLLFFIRTRSGNVLGM